MEHRKQYLSIGLLFLLAGLSSCAHQSVGVVDGVWTQSVIDYQQTLPVNHPDQLETVLEISDTMRDEVLTRFSTMSKYKAARKLAKWLLAKDGQNMIYDVDANLKPRDAYEQRRGNCLSFTLLLAALAESIDIHIEFNAVDIPNTWGLDEDVGMVFYRHVNGVLKTPRRKQIFDLAMQTYDAGYPQRIISRDQAMALFLNNLAIEKLGKQQLTQAVHPLKLAVSHSPKNPDLWANLGVVMKRLDKMPYAEQAFLFAYGLDKYHVPAISNLERFYLQQNQSSKATLFAKRAKRARKSNPYYHYQVAQSDYDEQHYSKAGRRIKTAIKLHNQDPRFFELKSRIEQQQHNYKSAIKSLTEAYKVSFNTQQRDRYMSKAKLVSQRAIEEFNKRQQEDNKRGRRGSDVLVLPR